MCWIQNSNRNFVNPRKIKLPIQLHTASQRCPYLVAAPLTNGNWTVNGSGKRMEAEKNWRRIRRNWDWWRLPFFANQIHYENLQAAFFYDKAKSDGTSRLEFRLPRPARFTSTIIILKFLSELIKSVHVCVARRRGRMSKRIVRRLLKLKAQSEAFHNENDSDRQAIYILQAFAS